MRTLRRCLTRMCVLCATLSSLFARALQSRTVASLAGSGATTQDCGGADRGWLFASGESASAGAVVSGLTIMRGHANGGAGMLFISSSAAVSDVVFAYGVSDGSTTPTAPAQRSAGGGVSLYNSSASFTDVTFRCVLCVCMPRIAPSCVHTTCYIAAAADASSCAHPACCSALQRQPGWRHGRRRCVC
jgi:hypothetical protein